MIQGFLTTVQSDFSLLYKHMGSKSTTDDEQSRKVNLAAMRFFALVGMGISIVITVKALRLLTESTLGSGLTVAVGVAIFVLSHDVFVIAKNTSEQMSNQTERTLAVLKSLLNDLRDFVARKKGIQDPPRLPITEGTFLRSTWDKALARSS